VPVLQHAGCLAAGKGGKVQLLHLFGFILFFAGFIPLAYAMWKKITNGRVFALYFVATAIIVITGIVLTFI
jgi:hypothetical protein